MHGRHLTLLDREVIAQRTAQGWCQARIAGELGCHPSTVARELVRNRSPDGAYFPSRAQGCADQRRRAAKRPWKLEGGPMEDYVRDKLGQYWSPEQIAGRLRYEHPRPARPLG